MTSLGIKAAKYDIQKLSTCRASSCCEKYWERGATFRQLLALLLVFHQTHNLSRNKCRHLRSILSKLNEPINSLHFFNPQQMFLFRDSEVDPVRWNLKRRPKTCCATSWRFLYLIFCRLKQLWQFFRAYTSHLWNGGSGCPSYGKIWENQPEAIKSR